MPQLSPLNWVFLFLFFWLVIIVVSLLVWWSFKVYFVSSFSHKPVMKNKWNW